jgi:hypothetical protein
VVFKYNGILFSHEEDWNFVFSGKWMELENIILSEFSQVQKVKSHVFFHMWDRGPIQLQAIL